MLRLQIHIANSMVSQQINSQGSKFNTKRRNFSKTESFVQKRWRIVRYWKTKHIWVWRFWSVRLLSSGRIAMLPQLSSSAAYATQGHPKNCLRSWRKFLTKCMKYNHMCVCFCMFLAPFSAQRHGFWPFSVGWAWFCLVGSLYIADLQEMGDCWDTSFVLCWDRESMV